MPKKAERTSVERVSLSPMTRDMCRALYRTYVPDPAMTDQPFVYSQAWADAYFDAKTGDSARRVFAVLLDGRVIGECQLKRIDPEKRAATLSIILSRGEYKNRGFGTEAEALLVAYAFDTLGLDAVLADTVLRNERSRHVLEKNGFVLIGSDASFKYYRLDKSGRRAAR